MGEDFHQVHLHIPFQGIITPIVPENSAKDSIQTPFGIGYKHSGAAELISFEEWKEKGYYVILIKQEWDMDDPEIDAPRVLKLS